jgi:glycosyltransferase involved in cell wall biosynthesis
MTRMLTVSLITLGDPGRLTGGYRYHRRMAELAPACDASVRFVSVPDRPFPLPALAGRAALRRARADVLALDSIAAAFLAPWLPRRRPGTPLVGSLHQPPGGIDHGPLRRSLQAPLDRLAYRRARLLVVASQALGDELAGQGFPAERIRVVPPGRDLPAAPDGPPPDLRRGRHAALLCVANWVERKGLLELLEATARLPHGLATLHLAGDDRADPGYAARVRDRLARPDLAGRVVVHGPLPAERVAALYRAADVFALPSLREPYGTVWGEAMAAGLPVVGWRAGTCPTWPPTAARGCWPTRATWTPWPSPWPAWPATTTCAERWRRPRPGGPPPDPPGHSRRPCSSPPSARPPTLRPPARRSHRSPRATPTP